MTVPEGVSGRLLRGGHTVFPKGGESEQGGKEEAPQSLLPSGNLAVQSGGAYSKGLTWTEERKGLAVTELILCL